MPYIQAIIGFATGITAMYAGQRTVKKIKDKRTDTHCGLTKGSNPQWVYGKWETHFSAACIVTKKNAWWPIDPQTLRKRTSFKDSTGLPLYTGDKCALRKDWGDIVYGIIIDDTFKPDNSENRIPIAHIVSQPRYNSATGRGWEFIAVDDRAAIVRSKRSARDSVLPHIVSLLKFHTK